VTRKALTLFDDYFDMMSDPVRMKAWSGAIARVVQPGDVVVDLGAGLGLLTLMALRAGASRVYAIEKADSIELAKAVIEANGFSDRVVFLHANSKEVELPEKADVLVSETLGSFGVDENTLAFTADARDRFLKPGGRMVPEAIRPWLAPVESPEDHARVAFWRDVDGFDYSPALREVQGRMRLVTFAAEQLLAAPQCLADIDLHQVDADVLTRRFLFSLERAGTIHGLAGWFEVDLCAGITVSTATDAPTTHWQQAYFPFAEGVDVTASDFLEVTLQAGPKADLSDDTTIRYDYRCTQLGRT
jgi:type I protein arginine methyltransferase